MMVSSRWRVVAGVACLMVGSIGQLAQFLVSPLRQADTAAAQVSAAAEHLGAMRLGLVLDLLILLVVPAVLYVGFVAGAARSRLAATGATLTFVTSLGAGYLLAQDVVVYAAALQPDRDAASGVVTAFEGNGVISGVVVAYLVGHTIGFILLGIALARSRAVPIWAGLALCVWPVAEMAGMAAGVTAVAAAGFALLVIGFSSCSIALVRAGRAAADRLAPVAPVGSATRAVV
jgi:hypothetical protein